MMPSVASSHYIYAELIIIEVESTANSMQVEQFCTFRKRLKAESKISSETVIRGLRRYSQVAD